MTCINVCNTCMISCILMKRFLSFISHIERSPKSLPLTLRKSIRHDARSTAGSNLSNIMLLFDKVSIDDIRLNDIDNFEYSPILPENQWRVNMVKEITDVQADQLNAENFSRQLLEEMMEYLCTS
jgi:hypothetical protein